MIRLTGWGALLLTGALLAPWGVLIWWRTTERRAPVAVTPAPRLPTVTGITRTRPGPWGDLELTRIMLEPPREFISTQFDYGPTRWFFRGATPASLSLQLATLPWTEAQRQEVLNQQQWEIGPSGITILPSAELVLSLSPDLRAALYEILRADPANSTQHMPARFRGDTADEWFANSALPPPTLALLKQLVYRRGNALLFSDPQVVLPRLSSDDERVAVLKVLGRKVSLLVQLRLHPDTNLDEVIRYWERGGRNKDIEPLLRSLPRPPGGFALDIAHLLPRFARGLLYTYPEPNSDADRVQRDCHWTSLNFFASTPNDQFADEAVATAKLRNDYYPIVGDPTFGDIIVFQRSNGLVYHSCVYIAADIVFTKNGRTPQTAWQLMQLADLLPWYADDPDVTVRAYRQRAQ